jgi:16S rRNA processing protein RimM
VSNASDTVIVGRIGAPYGVKGWVKINTFTEQPDAIFGYAPWFVGPQKKQIAVDQWKSHNNGLVAKLVGVEDRNQAELIKNLDIAIQSDQLPELEDGEFYWRDLVGMQVVTDKGYCLGTVKELFETGANDVMLVQANHNDAFGQKERLIPYLMEQVILNISKEDRTIQVDWDPAF